MRVTTLAEYRPEPGRLIEFLPVPTGAPREHPAPPSFNQGFHLKNPSTWLAFAFDLPARLDAEVLRNAFKRWIHRHDALRSAFRSTATGFRRLVVDNPDVTVHDHGGVEPHDWLTRRLSEACDPFTWPPYLLTAIARPNGFTVFCGFDHSAVDGYSLALAVSEVARLYNSDAPPLPPTSFVAYCAEEHSPDPLPGKVVRTWTDFITACGGTTPTFPLNLGTTTPCPQATDVRRLLDAPTTEQFEETCRDSGAKVFAGVLAAFGTALRDMGAGTTIRLLTPLHTRQTPSRRDAIGWFTTTAPLTLDVDAHEPARAAQLAFDSARAASTLHLPALFAHLRDTFRPTTADVFMVSYIDYRHFPDATRHIDWNAHHISATTSTDNAQFWVSRTHEGLHLRTRYPATDIAERAISALLARLSGGALLRA